MIKRLLLCILPAVLPFLCAVADAQELSTVDAISFGYTRQPDTSTTAESPVMPSNGSFTVSPAGAAVYNYAIAMPPGVGGMQPRLSIVYNSQSGNGIAGWGCGIEGLSVITRGQKTVFHDGVAVGIKHSNYDAFYVDGVRLFQLYGAPIPLRHLYFPEDKPYQQYTFGGPDVNTSVTTTTKEGLTCEYGGTQDARQLYTDDSGTEIINTWYINSVKDCHGNGITYKYLTDNGTVYPKEIIYGTNTKQDSHSYNYIRFNYEQRPDVQEYVIKDMKVRMALRLRSIETGTNESTYRTYTFRYTTEDLSGRPFSRLHTITEQNAAGESRPPVTFHWDYLPAFSQKVLTPQIDLKKGTVTDYDSYRYEEKIDNEMFLACDMTGDGLADIVEIASSTTKETEYGWEHTEYDTPVFVYKASKSPDGTLSYSSTRTYHLGLNGSLSGIDFECNKLSSCLLDFDGDGLADVCIPQYVAGEGHNGRDIVFSLIRGKDVSSGSTEHKVFRHQLKSDDNSPAFTTADIDCDGRSEVIVLEKNPANGAYVCEIIGYKDESSLRRGEWQVTGLPGSPKSIYTGDFNNDGMPDLIIACETGYKIYFNNGREFSGGSLFTETSTKYSASSISFGYNERTFQGDFNGDGLIDFLTNSKGSPYWYFHINCGNGNFSKRYACSSELYKHGSEDDDNKMQCLVFDFDHDGKSDVVMTNIVNSQIPSKTIWMRSAGTTLVPVRESVSDSGDNSLASRFALGCFTGSGQVELMNFGSDCYNTVSGPTETQINIYHNPSYTPSSGKVKSIIDETDNGVSFSYASLTDTDTYLAGYTTGVYPVSTAAMPLHVVSGVRTDNGAAGASETVYRYQGLQTHLTGRGMLGFTSVTARNTTTGDMVSTTINSRDPSCLMPSKSTVNKTVGGSTETTTVTNTYRNFPNRTFALEKTVSKTCAPDRYETTVSKTYDPQHGYLLTEMEEGDCALNYQETIYGDYGNYDSRWLPGTVTRISSNEDDDPRELVTRVTYNGLGQKVSECVNDGTSLPLSHEYGYDAYGNMVSESVSGNGVEKIQTVNEYDSTGCFVVKRTTIPESSTILYTYDAWGSLLTETDATNQGKPLTTTYTYNSWGQAETATGSTGTRAKTVRGWGGDPEKRYYILELADGAPWVKTWYDSMGREVLKESVGLKDTELSVQTDYDVHGRPVLITSKTGDVLVKKTIEYDRRGRVIIETNTNAGTVTYSYNDRFVYIDDNGRQYQKMYGDWGQIRTAEDPSGEITYRYSSFGKPVSVMPNSSKSGITMEYDDVGNRTALNDPDAGRTEYRYDALGRLRTRTDARGRRTSYYFDTLGRKTQILGDSEVFAEYKYGETGNDAQKLIEERSGDMRTTYSYDDYGRLSSKTCHIDGEELSYSYTYNPLGQVTRIVYPGGVIADYAYDCYGNRTSISVNGEKSWSISSYTGKRQTTSMASGFTVLAETSQYDESGRLTSSLLQDCSMMSRVKDLLRSSYTYDNATGNLTGKEIDGSPAVSSGGTILLPDTSVLVRPIIGDSGFTPLSADPVSSVDSHEDESYKLALFCRTESYGYDSSDRLVEVRSGPNVIQSMEYSGSGNILSKSDAGTYHYDSDKAHALTSLDVTDSRYRPGSQEASYNFFGKLETLGEWHDDEYRELTIAYGPDMERWQSTLSINGEEKRVITYSDDYERIDENGVTREFYYLGGNIILVRQTGKDDILCHAITDNQGSILCIVNEKGVKLFVALYDAWGRQEIIKNDIGFLRGYTGHEMLPEFDLINMNGRVYDPVLGRFLSPDNYVQMPDNTQSFNRYSYCINNPLKYTDPSGKIWWFFPAIAIIGGGLNVAANIDNINNFSDFFNYFGVGAVAGVAGAVTVMCMPATGGVVGGLATGFVSGSVAGSITGGGNALVGGGNFDQIIAGIGYGAFTGGVSGAIIGGITGGVSSLIKGENVWNGKPLTPKTSVWHDYDNYTPTIETETPNVAEPSKPLQQHHFATDKNKTYTPEMRKVTEKYNLDLDGDWNKARLPHRGRHPNAYHNWVLKEMQTIDMMPNMNTNNFVRQFDIRVIQPVKLNPDILYKDYWNNLNR